MLVPICPRHYKTIKKNFFCWVRGWPFLSWLDLTRPHLNMEAKIQTSWWSERDLGFLDTACYTQWVGTNKNGLKFEFWLKLRVSKQIWKWREIQNGLKIIQFSWSVRLFFSDFQPMCFCPPQIPFGSEANKKRPRFFSFSQPLIHFTCLLYWSFKRLSFRMHVMYGNPLMMLGSPLGVFLWDTARVNVSKHLQLP